MDLQDPVFTLDDVLWERLLELTGGEAALCYQCGTCTATCPWGLVRGETVSVREFIRRVQLGLEVTDALWLCTTCAQCEAYCPRGVSIAGIFRALREIAWERREAPQGLPSLLWSLYWNDNTWSQPPSQRAQWAKDLAIPVFDPQQHEILLYVGGAASYDNRVQKVAAAFVRVLRAAGVTFGILGVDEPPSGADVLDVGHRPFFEEMAAKTVKVFRERGVKRLVALSPHSYDAFKNHYPFVSEGFAPQHYTQYLAELLELGRLKLTKPLEATVAFQDPCYLARHNAETDAPRRVLVALPGVTLVEMAHSGTDTLCCGGGGGRMYLETEAGERFSDVRVEEAQEVLTSATGVAIMATACPYCMVCLEDSVKARKMTLTVKDIAEIVALTI